MSAALNGFSGVTSTAPAVIPVVNNAELTSFSGIAGVGPSPIPPVNNAQMIGFLGVPAKLRGPTEVLKYPLDFIIKEAEFYGLDFIIKRKTAEAVLDLNVKEIVGKHVLSVNIYESAPSVTDIGITALSDVSFDPIILVRAKDAGIIGETHLSFDGPQLIRLKDSGIIGETHLSFDGPQLIRLKDSGIVAATAGEITAYPLDFNVQAVWKDLYLLSLAVTAIEKTLYPLSFIVEQPPEPTRYLLSFDVKTATQRSRLEWNILTVGQTKWRYALSFDVSAYSQVKVRYPLSYDVTELVTKMLLEFNIEYVRPTYLLDFNVLGEQKTLYDLEFQVLQNFVPLHVGVTAEALSGGFLPARSLKHRISAFIYSSATDALIASGSATFKWLGPGFGHALISIVDIPNYATEIRVVLVDSGAVFYDVIVPYSQQLKVIYGA